MKKKLVLAGGGHAHMMTLANLHRFVEKGHQVTVVQPSTHHYYSGMGPGMLGGTYTPEDIRFATRHVVEKQGGTFVQGKIVHVDQKEREVHLESGDVVPYDVISFNIGSYVPQDNGGSPAQDVFTVKPIEKLLVAQKRILELLSRKQTTIGIVGGGPSAVEIAGNVWQLARKSPQRSISIRIYTNSSLMPNHPDGVRSKIMSSLRSRGIHISENCAVKDTESGRIHLANGDIHEVDMIFLAVGVRPSAVFAASGLPIGPDGGLEVNRYLQCTAYPEMFGGGDCIYFKDSPLDKVGVYAVRQNPVLLHNLLAYFEGTPLEPFVPGGDYLLIFNLGGGTGMLKKNRLQFGGRLAFIVKDFIDRRFMRKFQAIE